MKIPKTTEFINTYSNYNEPKEVLEQYQETMKELESKQGVSTYRLADRTGAPRGRIRAWKNGSIPDFIRALHQAQDKNLIELDTESERFLKLNELVSWIFSGGSIAERNFVPVFSIESKKQKQKIKEILDPLGIEYKFIREDLEERATEAKITEYASVIGRILYSLGAPLGKKNEETKTKLPKYLKTEECPQEIKKAFVDVYLMNRGTYDSQRNIYKFREKRNKEYLEELRDLISDVFGKVVSLSEKNIYIKNYK